MTPQNTTEPRRYLVADYETKSFLSVADCGAWEYSQHPSTEIRCVAWRYGTKEELKTAVTKSWSPAVPSSYGEFIRAMCDSNVILVAHNALFEQCITRNVLSRIIHKPQLKCIPPERWICTASMAAALALPRSLENAGAALGLSIQKDKAGKMLIRKHCFPQKINNKLNRECLGFMDLPESFDRIDSGTFWNDTPEGLEALQKYCRQDVDVETELFLLLPDLTPDERKVWLLDQKINMRGVTVDRELVTKTLSLMKIESEILMEEFKEKTGGKLRSPKQVAELGKFLRAHGVDLPNMQAKTVSDALPTLSGVPKRVLEIRQALSKSSTAKYEAFDARTKTDGRLRDILLYHGASTGRFTGAGAQLQNLPRGALKGDDVQDALNAALASDLPYIRALYGDPMTAFSSLIRGVLTASPGHELFCEDWAGIELRVLFWLAGHEAGLKALRDGSDLYIEMARHIYGVPKVEVTKAQREVGKRAVLGAGYGMGHKKFKDTCALFGVEVSEELAKRAIETYRRVHSPVVGFWYNLERAAIGAVQTKKLYTVGKVRFKMQGDFLFCKLPSGRKLAYHKPEIRTEPTPWGEARPKLYHYDVHPKTKQWMLLPTYGGKLTENNCQAVARDVMVEAMLRCEAAGYKVLLTVHDEILAEKEKGAGKLKEFERLCVESPKWADGLPLKVEGWGHEQRYKKN